VAIKVCLNETCGTAWIGKHLYDAFPMKEGLEQGDTLSPLLSSLVQNMPLGGFRQPQGHEIDW
jgi:hypothetical protein